MSRAYKASKALNVSAKLGVYDLIQRHPGGLTWKEIAGHMGWKQHAGFRGAVDFLDLLVSIGTLGREGEGPGAR